MWAVCRPRQPETDLSGEECLEVEAKTLPLCGELERGATNSGWKRERERKSVGEEGQRLTLAPPLPPGFACCECQYCSKDYRSVIVPVNQSRYCSAKNTLVATQGAARYFYLPLFFPFFFFFRFCC